MKPAGPWRRGAAWTLDSLPVAVITIALAWSPLLAGWEATTAAFVQLAERIADAMVEGMMQGMSLPALVPALLHEPRVLEGARALHSALWQLLAPFLLGYALLALPWHVLGELSAWQGSPGKRLLGLEVVAGDGGRLPPRRVLLRHVAGLLSWLSLNLGHAMAFLPPERTALHDRIAGARVVERKASRR